MGPQEPLPATVKRWKLAWFRSGISHAITASPKPSLKAPWSVGDAMVSGGNAGWTTLKSGHPCPCQNCSQGPSAGKTGKGSLLNRLSCPRRQPNWSRDVSELNRYVRKLKTDLFDFISVNCMPRSVSFPVMHGLKSSLPFCRNTFKKIFLLKR